VFPVSKISAMDNNREHSKNETPRPILPGERGRGQLLFCQLQTER